MKLQLYPLTKQNNFVQTWYQNNGNKIEECRAWIGHNGEIESYIRCATQCNEIKEKLTDYRAKVVEVNGIKYLTGIAYPYIYSNPKNLD